MKRNLSILLIMVQIATTLLSAQGAFAFSGARPVSDGHREMHAGMMAHEPSGATMHQAHNCGPASHEGHVTCTGGYDCSCCYLCCALYVANSPASVSTATSHRSEADLKALAPFRLTQLIYHPPKR